MSQLKKKASTIGETEVIQLVQELKTGSHDVKTSACALLGAFSAYNPAIVRSNSTLRPNDRKPEPNKLIARSGAIEPLVALLASGSDDSQIVAASTLASLAASHAARQESIAAAGAVVPLVSLLRMGSNKAQMQAASALASLSELQQLQAPIIKAGGVAPLVRLARVGTADAQFLSATAIANLCSENAQAQTAAANAGAVPILIGMLRSGKVTMPAASALARLAAGSSTVRDSIAQDGLAPLLALLNGVNVPAQVQAAAALAELARDPKAQIAISKAGGIRPLIAMLESRSTQAQSHGAAALAMVAAGNRENQEAIPRLGGMLPMVNLIANGQPVEVQATGTLLIAMTCHRHEANQTAAAELGVIAMLEVLLRGGNGTGQDKVKAGAAQAIWALSDGHRDNKKLCATAGAVSVLVALLASGSEHAREHAANALASLGLGIEGNQSQITAQLVDLLGAGLDRKGSGEDKEESRQDMEARRVRQRAQAKTQKSAASVLWRLLDENPDSHHAIARAGKTSDLITLLKGASDDASRYALWSLSLSIDENNQATVLQEGGVAPLVAALVGATPPPAAAAAPSSSAQSSSLGMRSSDRDIDDAVADIVQRHAAAALALLAHGSDNAQRAIADAAGIAPLIQIVASAHSALHARESAAACLADLALIRSNAAAIVGGGAIAPLCTLLQVGGANGKKCSAAALARLSHGSVAPAAIAEAGAIAPLISLLSGEHGEGAQEEGAHALFALADHASNRVSITEAGGIGPLVVLLGERAMRGPTSDHAEAALVRLSIEQANRVHIIEKVTPFMIMA